MAAIFVEVNGTYFHFSLTLTQY